jgi:elongation factor 2
MYQNFQRVVENANVIIATYEADDMGEGQQVDPTNGTVAFGSALFGWAFTLTRFAKIYSEKFKIDMSKMMQKLWGDNYYDAKGKKWRSTDMDDENNQLKRAFVQFIMEPVIRLCRNIMEGNKEAYLKMLGHLEISLKKDQLEMEGKPLFKCVF